MQRWEYGALLLCVLLAAPSPVVGDELPDERPDSLSLRVTRLLSLTPAHGLPFDDFATLPDAARPLLEAALSDSTEKGSWPNAITGLGIMGGPQSYAALHAFIWKRFQGEIGTARFRAMMIAVTAMGWDRAGPSEQAVHELVLGTDPTYWESLPWTHTIAGSPSHARVILSQVAINGLSFSVTSVADSTLKALLKRPHHKKQVANAREGLVRNDRIKKEGLRNYLRSKESK